VHLFPARLFGAIRRWFAEVGWNIPYPHETDEVLAALAGFGVGECWALPYAHKPGVAAELNAFLAGLQRDRPQVRGFFTVHPDDENVGALAREALDRLGLHGLKIHCEVQQVAVSDPRLDAAFDAIEAAGRPCVLHSGNAPYPYTRPHLDVARVAERLARNPRLKIVIAHLGAMQTLEYLKLCDRYAGLHLEASFTNVEPYRAAVPFDFDADLAPYAERLLFGSDFPNLTFAYAEQADAWAALPWVKRDAAAFFGGRARKLLGET